jgi:hypothetical protein
MKSMAKNTIKVNDEGILNVIQHLKFSPCSLNIIMPYVKQFYIIKDENILQIYLDLPEELKKQVLNIINGKMKISEITGDLSAVYFFLNKKLREGYIRFIYNNEEYYFGEGESNFVLPGDAISLPFFDDNTLGFLKRILMMAMYLRGESVKDNVHIVKTEMGYIQFSEDVSEYGINAIPSIYIPIIDLGNIKFPIIPEKYDKNIIKKLSNTVIYYKEVKKADIKINLYGAPTFSRISVKSFFNSMLKKIESQLGTAKTINEMFYLLKMNLIDFYPLNPLKLFSYNDLKEYPILHFFYKVSNYTNSTDKFFEINIFYTTNFKKLGLYYYPSNKYYVNVIPVGSFKADDIFYAPKGITSEISVFNKVYCVSDEEESLFGDFPTHGVIIYNPGSQNVREGLTLEEFYELVKDEKILNYGIIIKDGKLYKIKINIQKGEFFGLKPTANSTAFMNFPDRYILIHPIAWYFYSKGGVVLEGIDPRLYLLAMNYEIELD